MHFISDLIKLLPCVVTQLLLRILDQLNILGDFLVFILQLPTYHHSNLLLQSRLGLLRHRLLLPLLGRDDPFFLQALAGFWHRIIGKSHVDISDHVPSIIQLFNALDSYGGLSFENKVSRDHLLIRAEVRNNYLRMVLQEVHAHSQTQVPLIDVRRFNEAT